MWIANEVLVEKDILTGHSKKIRDVTYFEGHHSYITFIRNPSITGFNGDSYSFCLYVRASEANRALKIG